ncbi:hypothetical protein B0H63DRAFT_564740 [Podospora didyma]|uniref:Uncharacterized protein n=1 Tax=Podospora didyma TaxID=330526 RepID=A0AAE0K5V2_9PEZI|nr:hypothetical protein B0H63DRAFT_564740 [Podospora didyma]
MGALDGFPTTQPALKAKVRIADIHPCGEIHTGSTLIGVSIPGFSPHVNLKITQGHDWLHIDPSKNHARLSIAGVAVDADGHSVRMIAEGLAEMNEQITELFFAPDDSAGPKEVPFGFAVEHMRFECGEPYKALEDMLFAGSVRFGKDEDGLFADIRLARIVPGFGTE